MIRAALLLLCLAGPAGADPAERAAALLADVPEASAAVVATWTPETREIAVTGLRHAEGGPARPEDAWHVGSLTKAMTATLAARLVADGRIGWDARVGDWLEADKGWRDVTLAELLTHRSGMAANLPRWRAILRPARAGYVAFMLGSAPSGERGAFLYSNAGYVVAGAMLEAAGGASWEDLIRAEVFDPLGMKGAGFDAPPDIRGHADGPVPPGPRADNLPAMGPAGTVHATARDMLHFLAAHATRDPAFLPEGEWARLHAPVGDYAMGWNVSGGVLSHAGSNTLWFARVRVAPGRAAFVAVNAGAGADGTARALSALSEAAPPATPAAPRP